PLGPVSHIARVGSPFFAYDSLAEENGFAALLDGEGIILPSGAGLLGRGFKEDDSGNVETTNLFYRCPVSDLPRVACKYDPENLSVVSNEFVVSYNIGEWIEIQYPERGTLPIVKFPLGRRQDHTCNYAGEYKKRGEPFNLLVWEERPTRNIIDATIQGMTGDPTSGQYARGVYNYNVQFEMGVDHEFVR
ncbi:MAG: hypothetical protein AAGO57_02260, partial [Pseudomonadota bacterium]